MKYKDLKYYIILFVTILTNLMFVADLKAQVISYVDEDSNLIVYGEHFIPMGFYCEALPFDQNPDLAQKISDGGFNFIYAESYVYSDSYTEYYLETYKDFLNDCDLLNIKVVNGLLWQSDWPNLFSRYVDTIKQSPAVIAWCVMDDANSLPLSMIVNQKNQIIAKDQSRVTTISYYSFEPPAPAMMPLTELAFMQSYPWGLDNNNYHLDHSNYLFRNHVLSCQAHGVVPIATPQTFNWEFETYPSAEHVDVQSYLAFICGMKGILYYTMKDYDNNSTIDLTQPAVFNAAAKVTNEILNSELKEVILHGTHEYFSIYHHKYYATWRYNNAFYLIAVNTSADNINSYEINLPDDVTGNLINLFPDRPDDLYIQDGTLLGDLNPYQVAIYKMETTASIENLEDEHTLKIIPNPTNDHIFITGNINSGQIEIYDTSGKVVLKTSLETQGAKIDVSNLRSGIYFVKILTPNNQLTNNELKMIKL